MFYGPLKRTTAKIVLSPVLHRNKQTKLPYFPTILALNQIERFLWPQTRPQPCSMVHSNGQLPKLSYHLFYIGINERNFHTFQLFLLWKMRGSTSHCTNCHKLDFVLAPAKQFSLSALPGHCKNLTAVLYCLPDSNSNLNMSSLFDWLIDDNGPLQICPLGLLKLSSFCSDYGVMYQ